MMERFVMLNALKQIIKVWESLPEGNYSVKDIQQFLLDLAPAINNARKVVKQQKKEARDAK